jgi:hypothetical protein
MSRGLGKIESSILQYMERNQRPRETSVIIINVFYPERIDEVGKCRDSTYTPAQYKSILRSLASLERKGLIRSEKRIQTMCAPRSWYKTYVLTTQTNVGDVNT